MIEQHTLGPWHMHLWSGKEAEVRAGKNTLICGAALKADARLIAAAPDLLEALVNLLATHEGEGGTRYHAGDIARAAIAKARGEA